MPEKRCRWYLDGGKSGTSGTSETTHPLSREFSQKEKNIGGRKSQMSQKSQKVPSSQWDAWKNWVACEPASLTRLRYT
jgi:hypothetical protein